MARQTFNNSTSTDPNNQWEYWYPEPWYPQTNDIQYTPILQMSCPNCNKLIDCYDSYCKHCGFRMRKISLEERIKSKIEELKTKTDSGYESALSEEQIYAFENQIQLLEKLLKE